MGLTTKGRFAVTAMLDWRFTPSRAGGIGVHQRASENLALLTEQLFGKLRRHTLVSSVRGPGRGYNLGKPVDKLSVADIIIAVEEPIDSRQCEGRENCAGDRRCP